MKSRVLVFIWTLVASSCMADGEFGVGRDHVMKFCPTSDEEIIRTTLGIRGAQAVHLDDLISRSGQSYETRSVLAVSRCGSRKPGVSERTVLLFDPTIDSESRTARYNVIAIANDAGIITELHSAFQLPIVY